MEKETIFNLILYLIPIIIGLILWYFNKHEIKRILKKYNPFQKVKLSSIINLENASLIIENKEFLNDTKRSNRNRYIFWPVTPTDSPNLIHLLSLYYLSKLSENGLKIIVFVFDSYYEMILDKSQKIAKQDVNKFITNLKQIGLIKIRYKIFKESSFIENSYADQGNFAKRFYNYMGSISFGDLMKLKKSHITNESSSIRFFKSVLNMMYLKMVKYRIGFTFSGYDEKLLWESFSENPIDGQNMSLTNFYLPILPKINGNQANVRDKEDNLTIDDSISDINRKLTSYPQCFEVNGLIWIVLDIFLKTGETITIQLNGADSRVYTDIYIILSDIKKPELREIIIKGISKKIYELFHQ